LSKIKIFSLGGLNEIGKNMYVVEVDEDIFVFDSGLKYADDRMLGVDYVIPNYDYLKNNEKRIVGIFLTHGHDGQMGAIPDMLLDMPNIKIYGGNFTIEILRKELLNEGITNANLNILKPHQKQLFGKNSVFPVSLTHSVPDSVGYVLYTEDGAIFYTGNYVFDVAMMGSYKTDIGKLAYVGKQGVLCLLGESLYAEKKGFTAPTNRMASLFREILNKNEERILFNVYQTQIYRLEELLNEIKLTDKKVVILGKRLEEIVKDSIIKKYIDFDLKRLSSIHHVNEKNTVVIVSDEREKPFSNINRIVLGYDKFTKINSTDTIVFISPVYEGMERTATKLFDRIARLGANLIIPSAKKYLGHHASSEDILLMLDLIKPKYYFPVIGEYRHQVENARLASNLGMKKENILLKQNGEVANFINGNLSEISEFIKVDDVLIDGKTVGDIGELVLKDREALSDNGILLVAVTIDRITKKVLAGPEILTKGFIYVKDNLDLIEEVKKITLEVLSQNTRPTHVDFTKVKNGVRDKLGKFLYEKTECKPMILITLQEI
jgi:ribonuclease J